MELQQFAVDPQNLESEAHKEQPRWGLEDYRETIRVLREEKGFSLREIAAWLQERGLDCDHNAVWRICSRSPHGEGATRRVEQSERNEQDFVSEEAMPWLEEG